MMVTYQSTFLKHFVLCFSEAALFTSNLKMTDHMFVEINSPMVRFLQRRGRMTSHTKTGASFEFMLLNRLYNFSEQGRPFVH